MRDKALDLTLSYQDGQNCEKYIAQWKVEMQGAALIFNEMTTKVALGAVVMHSPAVTDFDLNPLEVIATGDWVKVDADQGIVEITKKEAH